jgi:hypothetical protein
MKRQNQILAIVLALQIILAGVLFWPRPVPSAGGAPLLAGLTADKVTRITVHDGTGQQVQLAKTQAGWVLPQVEDYPCQATKATGLLDKLAALKGGHPVTQTEASEKSLKVADQSYERLVELELSDGTRMQLFMGVTGGYGATHVRVQGKTEVYLATGLATTDAPAQASGWVDAAYLSVPADQVTALKVQNKSGTLEFAKDNTGAWTLKGLAAGETANASAIQTLVGQVTAVGLTEPLGKTEQDTYGLKAPSAVATITTHDQAGTDKTYTLSVGASGGQDGSYVVKSSETPYYARAAYGVQDLVNKARKDYLVQPTPAATVGATPGA